MVAGKLAVVIAMVLVFGQLQCAVWCTGSRCDLTDLAGPGSSSAPPCHRNHTDSSKHSDSSKQSPADSCSPRTVVAVAADFSATQGVVAAPLVAIQPNQLDVNARPLILDNESAVLIASPPGSGVSSSIVLRI